MGPPVKRRRLRAAPAVVPEAPSWDDPDDYWDENNLSAIQDPLRRFHELPPTDIAKALTIGAGSESAKRSEYQLTR